MADKTVTNGSKVKVHYTGKLEDGNVFDSSEGKDPLEFTIGSGQVIKGFEEGLVGMSLNSEKEIKLPAKDAYGERNETLQQKIPIEQLPPNLKEAKKGMYLRLQAPNGQMINALIADLTDKEITLDLNHPLAGKSLIFKIKVVGIE
jgi:FKBP-type peptidyl-prolyl cis-trans isomerase 2